MTIALELLKKVVPVMRAAPARALGTAFRPPGEAGLVTAPHVLLEVRSPELGIRLAGELRSVGIARIDEHRGTAWLRSREQFEPISGQVREAMPGEQVLLCGFPIGPNAEDTPRARVCVSYVMSSFGEGDERRVELQGAFPRGFSGSPVVAASDGALLGMLEQVGFAPLSESAGVGFHLGVAVAASLLSRGQAS